MPSTLQVNKLSAYMRLVRMCSLRRLYWTYMTVCISLICITLVFYARILTAPKKQAVLAAGTLNKMMVVHHQPLDIPRQEVVFDSEVPFEEDLVPPVFESGERNIRDARNVDSVVTCDCLDGMTVNTDGSRGKKESADVSCVNNAGIKTTKTVSKRMLPDRPMNLIFLSFDGMPRKIWENYFPLSRKYIDNEMGGIEMKGYVPTGETLSEEMYTVVSGLYPLDFKYTKGEDFENRRRFRNTSTVVGDYKKANYIIQWISDKPHRDSDVKFRYLPVDSYVQTSNSKAYHHQPERFRMDGESTSQTLHLLDWVPDFHNIHPDDHKLSFVNYHSWSDLSYADLVRSADEDLHKLLMKIHSKRQFFNTALFLMGFHNTDRTNQWPAYSTCTSDAPFLVVAMPDDQKCFFSEENLQLKDNRYSLTSAFDVHHTLRDLLHKTISNIQTGTGLGTPHLPGKADNETRTRFNRSRESLQRKQLTTVSKFVRLAMKNYRNESGDYSIGESVLRYLADHRTCREAGVAWTWCTCRDWRQVPKDSEFVQAAAKYVVFAINHVMRQYQKTCAVTQMADVVYAAVYDWRTRGSKKSSTSPEDMFYQLSLVTTPGLVLYEAVIQYNTATRGFYINPGDIRNPAYSSNDFDPRKRSAVPVPLQQYCHNVRPSTEHLELS